MRPEIGKLLLDMREATDAIHDFVAGKSLTDFTHDALLRSAIYFQFVIVGESLASASLPG
ncbi:MAG: hypothetical protein IT440_02570 [Phycisphaeraceae bacterium]|nr:hypothetical protein [Phycisphaeraceae bacterium]